MPAQLSFTLKDQSNENTTVTIPTRTVTAANFDEVMGNIATQGRFELEAAIRAVSTGAMQRISGLALDVDLGEAKPTDFWSQRETGLRVWGRGAVSGKLYSVTIGTADLDALEPDDNDVVSLANAAMVTLIAALEDYWEPNYDGAVGSTENVTVERAQIVGRRN